MARSGLQGVDKLRLKLRKMEKFVQSGIKPAILQTALEIEASAKQFVPVDKGDLQKSINHKVSGDGMAAVVGPYAKAAIVASLVKGGIFNNKSGGEMSALDKKKKFQFFKGYWTEFGTKGTPDRNIPPQPARPFMQPAFDANKTAGLERVKSAVDKQLKDVARFS